MNKAVLISIKPYWCDLIRSGRKNMEIRKNRPRFDTPFKVYIYETLNDGRGRGMVIGEFICDRIWEITPPGTFSIRYGYSGCCLTHDEVKEYAGWNNTAAHDTGLRNLYGWYISDLKIYDKPRNLHEFCRFDFQSMNGTNICGNTKCENYIPSDSWMQPPECAIDGCYLKYPPQSWCYVQERTDE